MLKKKRPEREGHPGAATQPLGSLQHARRKETCSLVSLCCRRLSVSICCQRNTISLLRVREAVQRCGGVGTVFRRRLASMQQLCASSHTGEQGKRRCVPKPYTSVSAASPSGFVGVGVQFFQPQRLTGQTIRRCCDKSRIVALSRYDERKDPAKYLWRPHLAHQSTRSGGRKTFDQPPPPSRATPPHSGRVEQIGAPARNQTVCDAKSCSQRLTCTRMAGRPPVL